MTSNNPNASQLSFDFGCEDEVDTDAQKTQPSPSVSAATEKSALDSTSSSLMERIVDEANVEAAWKRVKANRGAPGPDGVTVDAFPDTFRPQWPRVQATLSRDPQS